MKKEIRTDKALAPGGPYAQGLIAGGRIYVAGQTPVNPTTGTKPDSVEDQTRQVLENVRAIVEAGGGSMDDIVKTTVHLSDMKHFQKFNEVYKQFFKPPYPVRTTVASGLVGIHVEIDAIAELG